MPAIRLPESLNRDWLKLTVGVLVAAVVLALAMTGGSTGQPRSMFGSEPAEETSDPSRAKESAPAKESSAVTSASTSEDDEIKTKAKGAAALALGAKTQSAPTATSREPRVQARAPAVPAPATPAPPRAERSPAPSKQRTALTADRVRALPAGASMEQVTAALGPAMSSSAMRSRYGADPVTELLRQEPDGMICRYYGLVATEPAPFVRICFDANSVMQSREYVAPRD